MGENKGQTIFLSVIGIATLLVAIIGATFAYFTTSMNNGGETGSTITTAELKAVSFKTEGTAKTDVYPGASFNDTTVTVETASIPANTTIPYTCTVKLVSTAGTGANAKALSDSNIEWSATSDGNDTAVTTGVLSGSNNTFKGNLTSVDTTNITDKWTVKAKFINVDADQNDLQGATATINVSCALDANDIKYSATE